MASSRILFTLCAQLITELTSKILPLIILHIVVVRLGAEGYGLARFGFGLVDTMLPFIAFGYLSLASVELGAAQGENEKATIIGEVIALKAVHALVMSAVLWGLVAWVPGYDAYAPVVIALSFLLLTSTIDMHFVHVGTSRLFSLNLVMTATKLVSFVAIVLFVEDQSDVILFALLNFGTNGLVSLYSFVVNARLYGIRFPSKGALVARFRRSLPYVGPAVAGYALLVCDLYVVEAWFGQKGAGLYGGVQQISYALVNALAAFNLVFFSEIVGTKTREALTRLVDLGLFAVLTLVVPMACGVWFVSEDLLSLVLSEEYRSMGPVFSMLIVGLLGQVFILVFGTQVLIFKGEPHRLNLVMGVAVLGSVAIGVSLIDSLGYFGVSIGNAISRLLAGFFAFYFARSFLDHILWRDVAKLWVSALLMVVVLLVMPSEGLWVRIVVAALVYGVALGVICRERVMRIWRRVRRRAS